MNQFQKNFSHLPILSLIFVCVGAMSAVACSESRIQRDSELEGNWQNTCYQMSGTQAVYARNRLTFTADGGYKNDMYHYADANCITFTEINTQYSSGGIYRLGKTIKASDGRSAREIDIFSHVNSHDPNLGFNDTLQTIYSIADSTTELYFGASDFNTGTRPTQISYDIVWTKVP